MRVSDVDSENCLSYNDTINSHLIIFLPFPRINHNINIFDLFYINIDHHYIQFPYKKNLIICSGNSNEYRTNVYN